MTVATITETEWQQQVIDLAHALGWRHLHVRRSIGKGNKWQTTTNVIGWPDLTLFRPARDNNGEIIFAELKTESGTVTKEQSEVLEMLRQTGHDAYVWRPSGLDDVVERLGRHRATR